MCWKAPLWSSAWGLGPVGLLRRIVGLLAEVRGRVDDETWAIVLELEELMNARSTILLDAEVARDGRKRGSQVVLIVEIGR